MNVPGWAATLMGPVGCQLSSDDSFRTMLTIVCSFDQIVSADEILIQVKWKRQGDFVLFGTNNLYCAVYTRPFEVGFFDQFSLKPTASFPSD